MPKTHAIILERRMAKRIKISLLTEQVKKCADLSLQGSRGRGWMVEISQKFQKEIDGVIVSKIKLVYTSTTDRQSVHDKFPLIVARLANAGIAGNLKNSPWKIISPEKYSNLTDGIINDTSPNKVPIVQKIGEISLDKKDHYKQIYGRDQHISRVVDALTLAKHTNFSKRIHTLLNGTPGCGKTQIMTSTAAMLGKEGESWLWFDATSMTKAGVVELIMKSEIVPGVLFIEEIEKCPENDLRWLLGIMDNRGQIRRTNYRVGNEAKNAKMVVIASANDVELLKQIMSGALFSRFQNRIYCPTPDRMIMQKIMEREIKDISGDPQWIEPALKFAFDKWGITDPREAISILSCGRERLLSGEYQAAYETTMHPSEKKVLKANLEKRKEEN